MDDFTILYLLGASLVLIGIFILLLATVLMTTFRNKKNHAKTAGVVIIGPIPVIFGSDRQSVKTILVLSILLTAFLLAFLFFYHFVWR